MLIQGERINYLNVEDLIENIFADSEHAKRKLSIANAVLGVISSASLTMMNKMNIYYIGNSVLPGTHAGAAILSGLNVARLLKKIAILNHKIF